MTQQGPLFHYFPLLPTELRLEIWRYCLPSRIVEVHNAPYQGPLPGQSLKHYKRQLAPSLPCLPLAPPIISRVCQESRYFVLSHGGLRPIGLKHTRVWFDKRTDTISIDPDHLSLFTLYEEGFICEEEVISSVLQSCLSDLTIPLAIGSHLVECACELLFLSRFHQSGKQDIAQWAMERISQRTECTVVLEKVLLHLDYSDACACGLWGLLGESNPAHVDVQDPAQIQKLRNAYNARRKRNKRQGEWLIESLGEYLVPENINRRITTFTTCFESLSGCNQSNPSTGNGVSDQDECFPTSVSLRMLPKFNYVLAVYFCQCNIAVGTKESRSNV
ncbi:hypothetical protein F4679DRAFT_599217 [Xylaria curta]|nr:hypothetical protein F4679DRAFT_599217 [Xylaria curta]